MPSAIIINGMEGPTTAHGQQDDQARERHQQIRDARADLLRPLAEVAGHEAEQGTQQ